MSEGAWILLSTITGGGFGTIIAAIIKSPWKSNGNDPFDSRKCPAHSGLQAEIKSVNNGITRVEQGQRDAWDAIDEIRSDIKTLIRRG